jgi:hypothetical protein
VRVKFGRIGEQRKFIDLIIQNSNSPSLRGLLQFGLKINYQTLKSYYNENRTLPEELFDVFCGIGKIERQKVRVILLNENWGRIKGGKNSRKGKGKRKRFYRR